MVRRQFVNEPSEFVLDAVQGLALAHPELAVELDPLFVRRSTPATEKVALVSGGGTGHEPLHAGFIGRGMLDAAVPGAVFASPTGIQVAAATRAVDAGQGVVHIVKNYTGDVLNFGIAAELSADDGITVERVLVDDDVATDLGDESVGRRGTAATLVVEKVCGAAAERGASLAEIVSLGRRTAAQARSMAVALEACTHPETSKLSFELAADEVELGVGIHGERGRERIPFATGTELLERIASPVVESLELRRGEPVIAIVNGLGSTTLTEQYLMTKALHEYLAGHGITIARTLTGSYVTALDMAGVSVTLVRADDELLDLWDAPVHTPALRW